VRRRRQLTAGRQPQRGGRPVDHPVEERLAIGQRLLAVAGGEPEPEVGNLGRPLADQRDREPLLRRRDDGEGRHVADGRQPGAQLVVQPATGRAAATGGYPPAQGHQFADVHVAGRHCRRWRRRGRAPAA
jgi:hypothetical protein